MEATLTKTELELFVENSEVSEPQKQTLIENFIGFFRQTSEWKHKAKSLVITSVEQTAEMKMAREARLALKTIRVNTEHKRKELKEESLRTGQTIDAIAKIITNQIVPIEKHLEEQEKFIEIQENRRKDALREERLELLAPYEVDATFYNLREMPEENFAQLLENSRIAFEAKKESERKAEEERIAREKAEAEERERMRVENERLKKEAEEREKVLSAERAKAEAERKKLEEEARKEREAAELERRRMEAEQQAKLDAERKERERVEAELRAKAEAERKKLEEEAARLEVELSKGDNEKFNDLMRSLEAIKTQYTFKSKKYKSLQSSINQLIDKTISYAKEKA